VAGSIEDGKLTTPLNRRYNQGLVTSRDKSDLAPGELRQATGIYHKPGNRTDAFKLDGRSTFGDTSTSAKVDGLALCQFDSGSDKVLALSNSVVYGATPGASGTFSSLFTPSTSPTKMDAAHFNDEWFVGLGTENFVLKSDGTTASHGMAEPSEQPTVASSGLGTVQVRPDSNDSGWNFMARAYDAPGGETDHLSTAAFARLAAAGTDVGIWSFSSSDASNSRVLTVTWDVSRTYFPQGDGANLNATVTALIEYSEDGGSSYSTLISRTTSITTGSVESSVALTTGPGVALTSVKVRATLTYTSGSKNVYFRIRDIVVQDNPATAAISASELFYAYTEYDQTNDKESTPSPAVDINFTNKASVTVTLPSSALNSSTTHWRIYRTPDQGTESQLGLVGEVDVSESTWTDTFVQWGATEQPLPLIATVPFQRDTDSTPILIPRDAAPPALRRIAYFKGGLVGLTEENKRALHYSVPGFPHAWPDVYYIDAFPLPQQDELLDVQEAGGSLILGAKAAMIRLDEVPRSVAGTFIASEAVAIAGAPGCVGEQAMTVVPYKGRSHVAWISPENGVLVTDGHEWDTISRDIDWTAFDGYNKSGWVLHYLRHLRCLVLAYTAASTDTTPNRYYILHMDDDHVKAGGQAKVTGPHYGKIAAMASGLVSNTTRVYEAHTSDGKVYLNMNSATGADSSNAYNSSGDNPLIVQSGEFREHGWRSVSVLDALLYHSDFGSGQTATVEVTTGRDASGSSSSETKTLSLAGNQGHQTFLARSAGQWFSEKITHTGTGVGYIGQLTYRARVQGDEGEQKVVA
jgi:hypothetical protein